MVRPIKNKNKKNNINSSNTTGEEQKYSTEKDHRMNGGFID